MAALKNTLFFFVFIITIGSLSSCVRDILNLDCGKSISLGTLKFADSTKNLYSNLTGKEILVFKDSLGNEQEFSSKTSKSIAIDYRFTTKVLCDSGVFDKQTEYFNVENHFIDFTNANRGYFRLILSMDTTSRKDGFIFYDQFSVEFSGADFSLISQREKPIPATWEGWATLKSPNFVADTTIMGKNFKNVFYATDDYYQSAIYFQKTKMIIGLKGAGKTWLLDRVK
jgi:hypothetical protein